MSRDETLPDGARVADTYEIERFLAQGGMGCVYVARDVRLERRVAVKVLHGDMVGDAEAGARFQREARLLGRIAHPNVVGILGFGRLDESWYLAMEFVEGENLDELLVRRGHLAVDEAIHIGRQIASALAEAHALGIIHRDIKPGNVLLRRLASGGMIAKVADFGLARVFADSARDSEVSAKTRLLGTPAYMPPEQIQGGAIDGRADQYALAVLVYRMLTGAMPIWRQGTQALLIAHLVDPPAHLPALDGVESGVRAALDLVLQRALRKNADDRYATITEFADALLEAVGGPTTMAGAGCSCPVCDHRNPGDAGFCNACGAPLPLLSCPACNTRRNGERWFCAACGTSLRAPGRWLLDDADAGQRSMVAAVLVARLPEADAVQLAGRFSSLVEREGGRTLATVGRECVAAFGLGGMREGEVEAAVDAARAWLRDAEERHGTDGDAAVDFGVGLGFGPLATRGQASAWGQVALLGPAVDAARGAAVASAGQILCDAAAWRELRRRFHGEAADPFVRVGRKRDSLGARGESARDRVPLVGRHEVLDDLLAAARNCARRRGLAVAALVGERGSGRSRVLAEALEQLKGQNWRVLATSCGALAASPWQPFVDLMRAELPAAPPRTPLATLLGSLPALQAEGPERARRHVDSLLRLHGAGADRTVELRAVRPATDAEETAALEAYTAFIRGAMAGQPLIIAIDDADLARPQSAALLVHLMRELSGEQVLVALTMTTASSTALLDGLPVPGSRLSVVDVAALEPAASRDLVAELLGGVAVPAAMASRLHEFSGGRPAMLEEAVEALIGAGALRADGSGFDVHSLAAVDSALERGLIALVLERIGRLPPAERKILEAVALVGDATPQDMISAMLDRSIATEELEALVAAGQLRVVAPARFAGQREVALRQSMVAEVVAAALPEARRREMHERAGQWLLAWKGQRPPGFGALLARHYLGAGDLAQASRFLLKSAQESMRALANREAFDALGTAIETSRDWLSSDAIDEARGVLLEALLLRGELGAQIGSLDDAATAGLAAEQLAEGVASTTGEYGRARAQIVRGDVAMRRGEYDSAIGAFRRAQSVHGRGIIGAGLAALATARHAMVLLRSGDARAAEALATEALRRFATAPATPDIENSIGRIETVLGHLATRAGDLAAAAERYAAASSRFARGGDRIGAAMSLVSLGNAAYVGKDLGAAERHYRSAVEACEAIAYVQGLTAARTNLGNVLLDRNQIEAAQVELSAAEVAMRKMAALDLLPETLRLLALCRLRRGNLAGALSAATEAVAIARVTGNARLEEAASATLDEVEGAIGEDGSSVTVTEAVRC